MTDNSDIPLIDDPTLRDTYGEATQTLFGPPGILRIEICVGRWTQRPPIVLRGQSPVARIALPVEVARGLRDQLTRCIDSIDQKAEEIQLPAGPVTKQ